MNSRHTPGGNPAARHAPHLLMALLLTNAGAACAQAWPTKPVRLVLSQPPASSPDIVARLMGEQLTKLWGQSIVVENKPGGQNIIGAQRAASAAADGYTYYYATTAALVINAYTFKSLPYDPRGDFTPVGMIGHSPFVIAVHPDVPAKNLKELIAHARANPGKLAVATEGSRTFSGMMAAMFAKTAGVNLVNVPYNGVSPGILDTIAGRTQAVVQSSAALSAHFKTLRPIAVTSPKRIPGLEDTPALGEFFPGFRYVGWHAVVAPQKTPALIIQRVNKDMALALKTPETARRLAELGLIAEGAGTPAQLGEFLNAEHARWSKLTQEIGVVAD
jgi:tripartite-type tricarboxylate transporter receptor subunit TctC